MAYVFTFIDGHRIIVFIEIILSDGTIMRNRCYLHCITCKYFIRPRDGKDNVHTIYLDSIVFGTWTEMSV